MQCLECPHTTTTTTPTQYGHRLPTDHTTTHHRDVTIQVVCNRMLRRTIAQNVIIGSLYYLDNYLIFYLYFLHFVFLIFCLILWGAPGELRGVVGWGWLWWWRDYILGVGWIWKSF